jgi:hypothetical protein
MSDEAPHPTPPRTGAAATTLRLLLWLFILLAGLAVVLVLPMILVLNAVGSGRPGIWPLYVWVPVVFLVSVCALVGGLRAMAHPRLKIVALLAALAILAFFSFPLFWLPES